MTVDGSVLTADFDGTDPQARGPMNANYSVTASAVYNAILHLTDPNIPRNDGCYRPIKIEVPLGSILNCKHPAALVGGNTEISPRITDMILAHCWLRYLRSCRLVLGEHLVASFLAAIILPQGSLMPTFILKELDGGLGTSKMETTW